MAKCTIESLKLINENYNYEHSVTQRDVDKANELVFIIENSRNNKTPKIGDIVNFTDEYGNYYENAHIESVNTKNIYICENAYTPFAYINKEKNGISTNTSGGAWEFIPKGLKHVNVKEKRFCDWGHSGVCGNGAFNFFAKVNVWEYIKGNPEFTTKNYDKFIISITNDIISNKDKYIIRKNGTAYTVFNVEKEYQAWLKTFNGVERNGNRENNIVWTYKQEEKCVPLTEYLNISNAVIDSTMCNCSIQECKRVYSENKVTTYIPHQNDRIELKNIKIEYMAMYKN